MKKKNKIYVDRNEFVKKCEELCSKVEKSGKKYKYVFGVPRGGCMVELYVAQRLNLKSYDQYLRDSTTIDTNKQILIVDDLIDSGRTRKKYGSFPFMVLYDKRKMKDSPWIEFYYEKTLQDSFDLVTRQIEFIGDKASRMGLAGTPERVVRMWNEMYRGYRPSSKPQITMFLNGSDGVKYDEMVVDTGRFYSSCEHHMIPFFGNYYFAYIPGKTIIGLSKVARIIDYYSAKLQIQERLGKEILDELEQVTKPKGIALVLKARHLCKEMRGCRKIGEMTTSDMRGAFRTKPEARAEFLSFVNGGD